MRVIESGRVATGTVAFDAATQNLAEIKGSRSRSASSTVMTSAIDRTVTCRTCRAMAADNSGDGSSRGIAIVDERGIAAATSSRLRPGRCRATGTVTDTLNAEVGSGDTSSSTRPREVDGRERGLGRWR